MSASDRRRRREADQRSGTPPHKEGKVTGKNVDGGWAARAAKGKSSGTPRTDDDRWSTRRDGDAADRRQARPQRDPSDRGGAQRSGGFRRDDHGSDRGGSGRSAGDRRRGDDRGRDTRAGSHRADADSAGRGGDARESVADRGARPASDRAGDSRRGSGAAERDSGTADTGRAPGRVGNARVGGAKGGSRAAGVKAGPRADDSRGSGPVRSGSDAPEAKRDRRRAERPDPSVPSPRKRRGESTDPAREVALDVLRAVRERDAYANLALPKLLRERKISGRDAAFATELTYGASRSQGQLDAVIAACAGRPVAEIDGPILDILRLGVYQLLRTRTGAHAAVDTSVDLARAEFGQGRAGFVNAVLRRAGEKTAEEWVAELAPDDPVGKLAFEYAHPTWIAQSFADALGAQAGELGDLLAADDERPVVHLVARPGEITSEELALVTGGEEGRLSPYAVYLDGGDPGQLEPVREGIAAVQDEGSQLVALALTRAPLDGPDQGRWLDLCAGPGGKAALLGALAAIDLFTVDAVEPAEHRAELVRKSTRGLPVTVHVTDGRDSGLAPGYDRVLVDAPCTGLGALRRRPEARWRRTPADIPELVTLQRELLTAAWDLVRPGGVVVYSTCSPHLSETVAVVADFVRRTGAEQLDTRDYLPGVTDLGEGPSAQLWPHRHGTDAMFLAALRKS